MLIRHLKISNFRGIENLNWTINSRITCLLGQNDSTKTTILDALELGLWPRAYYPITDSDFYKGDTTRPIRIEVTVGELPNELIKDDKFGLFLRGFTSDGGIIDDPIDGSAPVVTICCEITSELEPVWTLLKESAEPRPVSWRNRERLGLARLGAEVERHLTWSRGSALARLTTEDISLGRTLADISRAAKKSVAKAELQDLRDAASTAQTAAMAMGAKFTDLNPGLDTTNLSLGNAVIGLHQEEIPLRLWGLGTKRLAALAIQQNGTGAEATLLIDEIEHGLEPHRIRHLLKKLTEHTNGTERERGQVILTSHSPTTAITLNVKQLGFVRKREGTTTVTTVESSDAGEVQAVVRAASHALFGRKLLLCEGPTEVGLCRGLEQYWETQNEGIPPANVGLVSLDGGGRTNAPKRAIALKKIGYDVAVFADSDAPIEPDSVELNKKGIRAFLWSDNLSTEERLAKDLPLESLQELIDIAIEQIGYDLVIKQITSSCQTFPKPTGTLIREWISGDTSEPIIRQAIGRAAKSGKTTENRNGWFKNYTLGEELGRITGSAIPKMADSPTSQLLQQLMSWIYD